MNKKAEVVRVYLPPDANTLLSVADHCLRSKNYINLIVAGKQPAPQWLTIDEAVAHCTVGLGVWKWASNDEGSPDVVMACSGDVPTMEALAAVVLLRSLAPDLKIRVVNVVDLMALQPPSRASARPARRGLRPHLPAQNAHGLRLPRLSVAAFTGSPTGGIITITCTCAATRKRAPRPRPSICACSTTSTASSWRWTRSSACRGSRSGRRRRAVVLRGDSAPQALRSGKRRRSAGDSRLALASDLDSEQNRLRKAEPVR